MIKNFCFNILRKEMKRYHLKSYFKQQYPQLVVTSFQRLFYKKLQKMISNANGKLKDFIKENKNSTKIITKKKKVKKP